MKKQINYELYESPQVEIIEMNSVQVMCTSPSGTPEQYNNGSWSW